jgi:hypothetical protein
VGKDLRAGKDEAYSMSFSARKDSRTISSRSRNRSVSTGATALAAR